MKRSQLWIGFLLLAAVSVVRANDVSYKGKTEIGVQAGGIFFENDGSFEDSEIYGGRIGHYVTNNLEVEASLLAGETSIQSTSNDLDLIIPTAELQYYFGRSHLRPYFAIGAGVINFNPERYIDREPTDFIVTWGAGLKWLFTDHFAVRVDGRHLIDTEVGSPTNNATLTGGVSYLFGGEKEEAPVAKAAPVVAVVQPVDTDKDGVTDDKDACPNTPAGSSVDARGCTVVVDSDADGVPDSSDACPQTPAGMLVDAQGCPAEQTKAIPKAEWVLSGVNFTSGSDQISQGKETLDQAAGVLMANPTARIEVAGYTDNTGQPETNQALSEKRAMSVKNYLVSKGIAADRLEAKGYGETMPKADNKTKEGRAANRRIEFKVLSR